MSYIETAASVRVRRARIASIMASGFLIASFSATYLDSRLTTHVVFGAHVRTYPLGYAIILFVPLFFGLTYLALTLAPKRQTLAAWLPATILTVPFFWNFRPEFPHAGFAFDIAGYSVIALTTAFVRSSSRIEVLQAALASSESGLARRIEEGLKDWRGIFFLAVTTFIVVAVTWLQVVWILADHLVSSKEEQWLVGNFFGMKLAIFLGFIIIGPITEIAIVLNRYQRVLFELDNRRPTLADGGQSHGHPRT